MPVEPMCIGLPLPRRQGYGTVNPGSALIEEMNALVELRRSSAAAHGITQLGQVLLPIVVSGRTLWSLPERRPCLSLEHVAADQPGLPVVRSQPYRAAREFVGFRHLLQLAQAFRKLTKQDPVTLSQLD